MPVPLEESHLLAVTTEPTVTFTVKEILVRVEAKLDHITGTVLKDLADRVTAIEHEKQNRNAIRENWFALIALVAALAAGLGTLGLWLHG